MTVYSFYSYKGGVGRSMTLANLAALFYRRPLNVIVVDWDLEAPGIERYFAGEYANAHIDEVTGKRGLCDLISDYRSNLADPPEVGTEPKSPYPSVEDYLVTLDADRGCRLRLMTAGSRSDWAAYAGFVQSFDWSDFYTNWAGGGFFNWLREQLVDLADIVLIDTRTGVTEMGGVATRHMADVVVVMFAGNEENMESSARMAETFLAGHSDVILVPSRIDGSDSGEFGGFLSRLADVEVRLGEASQPDGWQMLDLLVPYHPRLAFREQLVVGNETLEAILPSIAEAYRRIATQMQRRAPEGSRLRIGAGVARGRIFLLEYRHQRQVADQIRGFLEADGFEVVPAVGGEPAEAELAGAGCLVALIDSKADSSRSASYLLSHAERLGKRVIPVLLGPTERLPLSIADIAALRWDAAAGEEMRRELLRAIHGAVDPSSRPDRDHPDVFLCYSPADRSIAQDLARALRARGIGTWLDTEIVPGADFVMAREQAIDEATVVVVLASPSYATSKSAQQEVAYATRGGKRIIPVRLGSERPDFSLSALAAIDATNRPIESVAPAIADVVAAPFT